VAEFWHPTGYSCFSYGGAPAIVAHEHHIDNFLSIGSPQAPIASPSMPSNESRRNGQT
jgi:hypothetical protein